MTINNQKCLECGYEIDSTAEAFGRANKPREGDYSMCLNCGAVAIFDNNLQFRKPNKEEKLEIAGNPAVMLAQLARSATVDKDLRQRKVAIQ
jgi:hypothetical protein